MNTPSTDALNLLQSALNQLVQGDMAVPAFAAIARQQPALLATLPARFAEVLNDLLERLEASALFTEESCSFSQRALTDNLQMWIDKARARLAQA